MNKLTIRKPSRPVLAQRWTECGRIAAIVAAEFGIEVRELLSERKEQRVALPRMVAMYLAYRTTRLSQSMIGRQFGRDHTTVIAACKSIAAKMKRGDELQARVLRCEDNVRDPAVMAAERAIQTGIEATAVELEALADRAFALDPFGATAAVTAALRGLVASREEQS